MLTAQSLVRVVGAVVDAVALGVQLVDALLVLALEAVVGADAGGCGETEEEEEEDRLKGGGGSPDYFHQDKSSRRFHPQRQIGGGGCSARQWRRTNCIERGHRSGPKG